MRNQANRHRIAAETFSLMFTEECTARDLYSAQAGIDDVVYVTGVGKDIAREILFDGFDVDVSDWSGSNKLIAKTRRDFTPPEWRYTTHYFRMKWLIHVRKDNHSRPMTLWPGNELVERCLANEVSLAQQTRKIINERLRRLVGRDQYDLWLRIEAPPGKSDDVHFHGFLEMYDPTWWRGHKYQKLRNAIKKGVGTDCKAAPNKQLYFRNMDFDSGWLAYAAKERKKHKLLQRREPHLSESFVEPWEAQTRRLRTRAIERYEDVRQAIKTIINP